MAIYKIEGNNKKLVKVDTTSLGEEVVWERELQRMLRDQPEVLEDGLLIISEEFGNWQDSNRRIDLLGLDAEGRLVVVELKRGETGSHMDLQAIRYAAMVANMTYEQTVSTYQTYMEKRANGQNGNSVEEDAAETALREHLGSIDQDDPVIRTDVPRIILASENFSKELTTCIMWLNDSWLRDAGQEIKCVRLQPHRNGNEVLIEASVVIPLPEASDYQIRVEQRGREIKSVTSGKVQNIPGAVAFKESIDRAPEQFQLGLVQLYDTAIAMEQEKIANLSTRINRKGEYIRLELRPPGKDSFLVSFNNLLRRGKERGGEISFWRTEDDMAPNGLRKFDQLIGEIKSDSGVRHRRLSRIKGDELNTILDAICDAYREASGIPPAGTGQ